MGAAAMPDKTLAEIIGNHLSYEIDMLRSTYKELQARANKPAPKSQDEQTVHNALVEAFCVHARSLLDFFADKRSQGPKGETDAIASDFTTGFVTALNLKKEPLESLRNKLNKQIFHLTTKRTIIDAKKFDVGVDGVCLLKLIEPEIEKFTAAPKLKPEFKSFKCETSPITVFVGLPFSASTAIAAQTTIIEFGHHPPKSDQE
jgi:hypothetical protein